MNVFFFSKSIDLDVTENNLTKILKWSFNRITNINELINDNYKFIWIKPSESSLKSMDYDRGNKFFFLTKSNVHSNLIKKIIIINSCRYNNQVENTFNECRCFYC